MDSQQLIDVGWRLTRPCLLLNEAAAGEPIVAIWEGSGVIPAPDTSLHHIITIDCRFLPQNPHSLTGCLSVYGHNRLTNNGVVMVDPHGVLSPNASTGIRLSGQSVRSFPPIDAVVKEPVVHAWLAANGWEHNPDKNTYFDDDDYNAVFQEQCPIYTDQAIAVLGGWHFPWADKDWDDLRLHTLIVWTFRNVEPWIEVLMSPQGQFEVRERIT